MFVYEEVADLWIAHHNRVPYAALTATFSKIAATTKRLEISAYLTEFLVNVIDKTPDDLLKTVYLCINRVSRLFRIVLQLRA